MNERTRRILRRLLPALVVVFGVIIMMALISQRKNPVRTRPRAGGVLVEVLETQRSDRRVVIRGTGTVAPRDEVALMPQVSGRVVWVHPELEAGGRFQRNVVLLRIEPADYEAAVQKAEALVAQAEYQMDLAQASADVARREWDRIRAANDVQVAGTDSSSEPEPLVLHEPQLRQAEAGLISASAALQTARLNLKRTEVPAPFNCRVRRKSVAVGQLVGPGAPVATVYGTDLVEIEVGLPVADLAWIDIPGSEARITMDTGEAQHTWTGRIDRSVGVLDEIGRLARVVVQIRDPFVRRDIHTPELSIGAFVTVAIEGRYLRDTVPIPRRALRENSSVWIVSPDGALEIRPVSVARLTAQEAFIESGLNGGERLILTPISGAAPGMALRIAGKEARS